MNNSKRIYADVNNPTEKNIKIKLEQDTNFLEILSLQISQKEAYQFFNADYGVLVGRVIANEGVGIPNAKVSIFIPVTDEDREDSEIYAIYPYITPRDKNLENKRYNLLPRVAKEEPETGALKPKQPFGSFPTKEELVANDTWLEVYEKYYKYSTITNDSGDYMLFGIPTGVQTVHMSVDITDIGKYSMTPADMITQLGYSPNLFTNEGTEIKESTDLNDLPNIETQEISVDVIPYWGDSDNFDIGITRQDFRIRAQLINNFVLFSSHATMGEVVVFGDPDRDSRDKGFYRVTNDPIGSGSAHLDIRLNRVSDVNINVYTYLNTIDESDIASDITGSTTNVDPQTDIIKLDTTEYYIANQNGQFILSIPCNRRKIITDEFGNEVVVPNDSINGIFTEFLGFITIEYDDLAINKTYSNRWNGPNTPNNSRLRLKAPTIFDDEYYNATESDNTQTDKWRKQYFKFTGGKFYGLSQFFATKEGFQDTDPDLFSSPNRLDSSLTFNWIVGHFRVNGTDYLSGNTSQAYDTLNQTNTTGTFDYEMLSNATDTDGDEYFGAQWMNLFIYLPQINWTYGTASGSNREQNTGDLWFNDYENGENGNDGEYFTPVGKAQLQEFVAGEIDTRLFARGDSIAMDFVEVPKEDIITLSNLSVKGTNKNTTPSLTGDYRYRTPANTQTGVNYTVNAFDENYTSTPNPYLFKGMYNTDCIQLLLDLNFI